MFMSIKTIITNNSAPSVSVAGKNLSRRTEGGQVIYDSVIEQSTSGSSSGAGNGSIKYLYITGNAYGADYNSVPASHGTLAEPGIYSVTLPTYTPPPYPIPPQDGAFQSSGRLACPAGQTTFARSFWSTSSSSGGRGSSTYSSGLCWHDGRLSVFNHTGNPVIHGSYALTLFYIPF